MCIQLVEKYSELNQTQKYGEMHEDWKSRTRQIDSQISNSVDFWKGASTQM